MKISPSTISIEEFLEAKKPSKLQKEFLVLILHKIQSTNLVEDRILADRTLEVIGITTHSIRSQEAAVKERHKDRLDTRGTTSSTSSRILLSMINMGRKESIMVISLSTTRLQSTTT